MDFRFNLTAAVLNREKIMEQSIDYMNIKTFEAKYTCNF